MARRRRRRAWFQVNLRRETLRGIIVLLIFAVAGILLLSMFNLAGDVGNLVQHEAARVFGWNYVLVPFVLLLVAGIALYPDRELISILQGIGIVIFFLSFNGLLNTLAFRETLPSNPDVLARSGGYVGSVLHSLFLPSLGMGGSVLILLLLSVASVLIIFNTSLRTLIDTPARWFAPLFGMRFRRRADEDEEEIEEEEEDVEEEEIEEEEPDEPEAAEEESDEEFLKKPKAPSRAKEIESLSESALTTRQRRQITIPFHLLEARNKQAKSGNIKRNQEIIRDTLAEFGIGVEMGEVAVGPTVTQYTLFPSRGVKLSRILALQNDLALALAAHPIRIEAPIPGTSLVGVEVPNKSVAMVNLRDLLDSKAFLQQKADLPFALGKDVSGKEWIATIEKMPHLLVAGATGSGKSVCLNALIVSLLYAKGPDELKLILIDPKRVELTAYEGVPHLLVPPVTKVDDAVNALKWTIREMERRLDVLSRFGAKDIRGFNKRSKDQMPYIVVVIDELADLMMTSGREVESAIVRIAQLARATGIHLVIATQRPSVDVITGTIKANFPGRIAFAVASQTDSRTILDMAGAEKLLGRGDMLFSTAETSKPRRLQGAFVSEDEIERVVKFLRQAGEPDYNYTITERERTGTILDGTDEDEELLEDAIGEIVRAGKASTSMIQRRLKVGYSRAARMMDILEEKGIIGPQDGAKPREVLIESWPPENYGATIPTAADDFGEAKEAWEDDGSTAEDLSEDGEDVDVVPEEESDSEEATKEESEENEDEVGDDWYEVDEEDSEKR